VRTLKAEGFASDPIVHVRRIPFSKNTCCMTLYYEFDCLDCFSPIAIFAPQPKNRPLAYESHVQLSLRTLRRSFILGFVACERS